MSNNSSDDVTLPTTVIEDGKDTSVSRRKLLLGTTTLAAASTFGSTTAMQSAQGQQQSPSTGKPNILFIMGDDIGWFNISAYNMGIMGYRTPNIDRIAKEGALFTDWYGQQSCTAGRAAFITGQSPIRTGLTKVGLPGAELGLGPDDPSVADVLKSLGYATGQFGKNHLGDRNEHLPTVHGFDEFFGNLYHLNAEEEPENPDYPKDPRFKARFGPRGVLKCKASDHDDPTVDPGLWTGGQTGHRKHRSARHQAYGDDRRGVPRRGQGFHQPAAQGRNALVLLRQLDADAHLHAFDERVAGQDRAGRIYPDGMVETDGHVGELLKLLDELGVANNSIVVYTTDNGAEAFTWPDGGTTPFRREKATNWEGGFRVPCLIRWPGVMQPGTIVNDIGAHMDFIPTFAAAAGETSLVDKLKTGHALNGKTFKVHLDGENLIPFFKGEAKESPREGFLYWSDDGDLMALRVRNWKVSFIEQHAEPVPDTPLGVWQGQFTKLRAPNLYNLRSDPFEKGTNSFYYGDWQAHRAFAFVPAQAIIAKWLESFKEFPPRAKAASFTVSDAMDKITTRGPNQD
jgi:arylsulfatase